MKTFVENKYRESTLQEVLEFVATNHINGLRETSLMGGQGGPRVSGMSNIVTLSNGLDVMTDEHAEYSVRHQMDFRPGEVTVSARLLLEQGSSKWATMWRAATPYVSVAS